MIIGCDEVGRGPLAGPVVACAVRLKDETSLEGLTIIDSKKTSAAQRKKILKKLGVSKEQDWLEGFDYSIVSITNEKIDEINILQASLLAMKTAVINLSPTRESILIDGNQKFSIEGYLGEIGCVVKGDSKIKAIALASIIAKDYRDNLMQKYAIIYPEYGWESNAGYPTRQHKAAIIENGITPLHRKSFRGVLL